MKALALIIGNSKYEGEELVTPENDAKDLAEKLKKFGFVVSKDTNVDIDKFNQLVDSFGSELDKYNIGVFYFAGHGMQIDGDNFLTATNTNFESEVAAKYSSITLYKIIDYMYKAKNETNIIILDACRDNPFEKKWSRSLKQSGLAPLYAPKGTLIAFATSPGETASNGVGRNGLYTQCLLTHLEEPNLQIEELFKRVRNSVYALSKSKQTTWEHTSLTGRFVFNSGHYIQATSTKYKETSIADKNYNIESCEIDELIKAFKSHNWYSQGPAVAKLDILDPNSEDKDKLFVLGRNLLQTVNGGEWGAKSFFEHLSTNLKRFSINGENHLLNGILFEIYFNSEGHFRNNRLKTPFFDDIMKLSHEDLYYLSFAFINEQLKSFADELFFIPTPQSSSISFDIVLNQQENKGAIEFKIEEIKYQNINILRKSEDNWYTREDGEIIYEPNTFNRFKEKISSQLNIPISFLTFTFNYQLADDSKLLFPFGFELSKN